MVTGDVELVVPVGLRRGAHRDEQSWIASAHSLVDLVQRSCALADLDGKAVLDVGCGTKLTKALLERQVPISRYMGLDVDRDVVEFLQSNVADPRFGFRHIDVRNALYNPTGRPLSDRTELPVDGERFDIIWLFSVFTHLDPIDYRAMLRLLRGCIRDDGWLVFSLYINEVTGTGLGPVDWLARQKESRERSKRELADAIEQRLNEDGSAWFEAVLQRQVEEHGADWLTEQIEAASHREPDPRARYVDDNLELQSEGEPPDFVDLIETKPLMEPLYSEPYARALIDDTGWRIESLNPPEPDYIQHYFVCRPI